MEITIDNKKYQLDVEAAKAAGILKKLIKVNELKPGDVFYKKNASPVLLVEARYEYGVLGEKVHSRFALVGLDGLSCYSNNFYRSSLKTLEEIADYLNMESFYFSRNIAEDVQKLMNKEVK